MGVHLVQQKLGGVLPAAVDQLTCHITTYIDIWNPTYGSDHLYEHMGVPAHCSSAPA